VYPFQGETREKLKFLLRFATLAPSIQNTQPWILRLHHDSVDVILDRDRVLTCMDPSAREATISVGAAIYLLRLAMTCHLMDARCEILPEPNDPDILARLTPIGEATPTTRELTLFAGIRHRHTFRGAFENRAVPANHLAELQHAAERAGAQLSFVADPCDRAAVADAVESADQELFAQEPYWREYSEWIRMRNTADDGIPVASLQRKGQVHTWAGLRVVGKSHAAVLGEVDRDLVLDGPVLAVLTTDGDGKFDRVIAGQALAATLLAATAEGLRCSFFSQVLQSPKTRNALRHALSLPAVPQMVMRLGFGPSQDATPRREVEDVLIERIGPKEKPLQ
jgi:hypothetical protein